MPKLKKNICAILLVVFHTFLFGQTIAPTQEMHICDNDGDGFVSISFDELQSYALDVLEDFNESPEIYVTKAHRGIEKITNLYNNPQIVSICGDVDGDGGYYDIAINSLNEIFVTRRNGVLQKVNLDNCNYQTIGQIHPNGQSVLALSFDHQDNLYEGGWTSKVYRADANNLTNFYLWHDFGQGNASGDFVQIGEFMYIAWTMANGRDYLLKVTMDEDNQYLSHENLGQIRMGTFGLAAEYGRLYGNTVDNLYEIDLETLETTTIVERPNPHQTYNNWWGAAGYHEALDIKISYHGNQEDAISGANELEDPYTNPIAYQNSFIYIRVHESTHNNTYIIPVHIIISIAPMAQDSSLDSCKDVETGLANFNLDQILTEINPDSSVNIQFFDNLNDLEAGINPIPTTISIANSKTVYAKVFENNNSEECYGIAEIQLNIPNGETHYNEVVGFCLGTEAILSIPNQYYSYQWNGLNDDDLDQSLNTNEVIVTHPGNYSVNVIDENGCEFVFNFEVVIGGSPEITEVTVNSDQSITVIVNPSGQYEYSLDGVFWQSSPTFQNIAVNDYTIYVRDLVGCYSEPYEFTYFLIPNFISPNGDGKNDFWEIRGMNQYPDAHIQIFDRYGKLFFDRKVHGQTRIWDGTYLGRPVPSGTYWYIIRLSEGNLIKGHLNIRN